MVATTKAFQTQQEAMHYPELIIGEWCDANSLLDYMPDGRLFAHLEDGRSMEGTWEIQGDALIQKYPDGVQTFIIVEMTEDHFLTKNENKAEKVNRVIRINNR